MNERRSDIEQLRAFARQGDQRAFADVARRHLDLVYGTALRKLSDAGAAEEVAQNVFLILARKAWRFAADDSLPAWLHRATLLECKHWLRGELRRRRREETAAQLGTTMKTSEDQPAFNALVPLLDEALLSLREKDRAALLLRFCEGRSLREVGASLGISDDTAQKRVAGALDKIGQFFQRRGFKTVTSAAAAAALQQSSTSVSAATATAVISGALKAAPPALGGLGLVAAKLAGLTKAQTAAVCLALVALPVAWEWKEARALGRQAEAVRSELALASEQEERLRIEVERLQSTEARLRESLASAAEARERGKKAARRVEAWKTRLRGLLAADDYRWPDDLPFVRIPKSAVAKIEVNMPITPPGRISVPAREMFGLTMQEREALEKRLGDYFAGLDRSIDARIYETNRSSRGWNPSDTITSTVFVVPRLGEEAKRPADEMLVAVQETLGPERWDMVEAQANRHGTHTLRRVLALDADHEAHEARISIYGTGQDLTWRLQFGTQRMSFGNSGMSLAGFLPNAEPEMAELAQHNLAGPAIPIAVQQRIRTWLEQEARTRLTPEGQR